MILDCLLCFSPEKLTYFSLKGKEEYVWMYTFYVLGSLQRNMDVRSQLDASKVTYLELSVRQEMKRKWSERLGDEFTASSIRHLDICQL